MSPTQARLVAMGFRDLQGEPEGVAEVRDILVPGPAGALPVRLYHPLPGGSALVVYFHGGGWVIGDIEIVDKPCRALANASQCVVASVNYRIVQKRNSLGRSRTATRPQTGWPSTRRSVRCQLVAVPGDSAGGNLAAAVALMARDRGAPSSRISCWSIR